MSSVIPVIPFPLFLRYHSPVLYNKLRLLSYQQLPWYRVTLPRHGERPTENCHVVLCVHISLFYLPVVVQSGKEIASDLFAEP